MQRILYTVHSIGRADHVRQKHVGIECVFTKCSVMCINTVKGIDHWQLRLNSSSEPCVLVRLYHGKNVPFPRGHNLSKFVARKQDESLMNYELCIGSEAQLLFGQQAMLARKMARIKVSTGGGRPKTRPSARPAQVWTRTKYRLIMIDVKRYST